MLRHMWRKTLLSSANCSNRMGGCNQPMDDIITTSYDRQDKRPLVDLMNLVPMSKSQLSGKESLS